MTRPQQVTRSLAVAHEIPVPRDLSQGFFWSAAIHGNHTYMEPNSGQFLNTEIPLHSSNGDQDFDVERYPIVGLKIPRDGIYALALKVFVGGTGPVPTLAGEPGEVLEVLGQVRAAFDIAPNYFIDPYSQADAVGKTWPDYKTIRDVELKVTRVGFPLMAGALVRAYGYAWVDDQEMAMRVDWLEATYLGPIGTIYPDKDSCR